MSKHYVVSTKDHFLEAKRGMVARGEVISGHKEDFTAREVARKLNGAPGGIQGGCVALESTDTLKKGECYPELLDQWLALEFEKDATWLMAEILGLEQSGENATAKPYLLDRVLGMGLTLDELREGYAERAQQEIDQRAAEAQERAERAARRDALERQAVAAQQEHCYSFPAVRGVQAGKEFYIAQIPYKVLIKLFVFDDEELPPELRAQRTLNEKRARDIGVYMVENPTDYVLPAITATVSQEMRFDPVPVLGASDRLGMLNVPMTATLLINDGQHRRAGIENAIKHDPRLADETVAVTIFFDEGLERSQQIFSDINSRAVKPSSAINRLYNQRDPFNAWLKDLIKQMPQVHRRIDMENSSIGANSHKLWSLVAFAKFVTRLTGIRENALPDDDGLERCGRFVVRFLSECDEHIPQWNNMIEGNIQAKAVRQEFVIGHTVFLDALAMFGNRVALAGGDATRFNVDKHDWAEMVPLCAIDPMKSASMWQGRCVSLGRMQPTTDGIKLTAAALIQHTGRQLPEDLAEAEARLRDEAVSA